MASRFATCRATQVETASGATATATARTRGATELQANVYDFNQPAFAFFTRLGLASLSHRLVRQLTPAQPEHRAS
jgi:hypothetical protein